jgi:nitroreductase
MKNIIQRRNFLKKTLAAGGTIALLPKADFLSVGQNKKNSESNETLELINHLRTIHGNFSNKKIPDNQLEKIIQAAIQAANSSNMQTYSIIVIKDREKMKDICHYQGSALLLFCADHNRIHASAKYLGCSYQSDTIVNFITAGMNTMLAAQTAVIAAKSMGIDSLLTNGIHRGDMERLWKLLELPEKYCFPMIALVLGYPIKEPAYEKGRLDGPGIIHNNTYHQLTKEELKVITQRYDDHSNHLALNPEWDKQGYSHYQDWLYKSWLGGRAEPSQKETQMFQLLKRSGYIDLQK